MLSRCSSEPRLEQHPKDSLRRKRKATVILQTERLNNLHSCSRNVQF